MTLSALVQALELVRQVYPDRGGSQPGAALKTLLQQLDGAGDMTVAEWVATQRRALNAGAKSTAKAKEEMVTPDAAIATFASARMQASLRDAMASVALSADQWKAVATQVTGRSARSGKVARAMIETHFSDRLLLHERVESVRRQFG